MLRPNFPLYNTKKRDPTPITDLSCLQPFSSKPSSLKTIKKLFIHSKSLSFRLPTVKTRDLHDNKTKAKLSRSMLLLLLLYTKKNYITRQHFYALIISIQSTSLSGVKRVPIYRNSVML